MNVLVTGARGMIGTRLVEGLLNAGHTMIGVGRSGDEDCEKNHARNVFDAAGERPVLYISTVDVYGFYDGKAPVNGGTPIHPVSKYGRSKAMAEGRAKLVLCFPQWMVSVGYGALRRMLGENEKVYLLNKAVHPIRSE